MPRWVCLPRGINLGSHQKVAMPRLRDLLAGAGFTDVSTYVQSGNIVATSPLRSASKVAAAVRTVMRDGFAVDTPVIVRTPGQLDDVVAWNPFPDEARTRPQHTYVVFLTAAPTADNIAALLDEDWSPERATVRGSELAITYAEGLGRSRLQHSVALRRLAVDGTARNWRTVLAIRDLC